MLSFHAIIYGLLFAAAHCTWLRRILLGPDKEAYCYLFAQVGVKKCHNYTNKYKPIDIYKHTPVRRDSNKGTWDVRSIIKFETQSTLRSPNNNFWFTVDNRWINKYQDS